MITYSSLKFTHKRSIHSSNSANVWQFLLFSLQWTEKKHLQLYVLLGDDKLKKVYTKKLVVDWSSFTREAAASYLELLGQNINDISPFLVRYSVNLQVETICLKFVWYFYCVKQPYQCFCCWWKGNFTILFMCKSSLCVFQKFNNWILWQFTISTSHNNYYIARLPCLLFLRKKHEQKWSISTSGQYITEIINFTPRSYLFIMNLLALLISSSDPKNTLKLIHFAFSNLFIIYIYFNKHKYD